MRRAAIALALTALVAAPARAEGEAPPPTATAAAPTATAAAPPRTIARIRVRPLNLFSREQEKEEPILALANALHIVTREHIVRRELLFEEGEPLDPARLAETERNLRALDFLRAADVTATARPNGTYDVDVETRDRWTIRVGLSAGSTGGISKVQLDVGDANFLGLGKDVGLIITARTDQTIIRGKYNDPNVLGTRIQLRAGVATSDIGTQTSIGLGQPFYSRTTPRAWRADLLDERADVQYFDEGDEVAAVPRDLTRLAFLGGVGFGTADDVRRLVLELDLERALYDAPTGEQSLEVRWPRNRDILNLVLAPSIDRRARFAELERLDAFEIVEDVAYGWEATGGLGGQLRDDSEGTRLEALLGASSSGVLAPLGALLDETLFLEAGAALRHDGERTQRRELIAAARSYTRFLEPLPHTLAWNVDFASAIEREDLETQLTLGEDNGLRGYEARQFDGTSRLRMNVEDRIFTPARLSALRLGAVLFADGGLCWDEDGGPSADDFNYSVGFGLRVFAPEFLKARVVRIDLAFPLGPDAEDSFSLSFSVGQVFTARGVLEELRRF